MSLPADTEVVADPRRRRALWCAGLVTAGLFVWGLTTVGTAEDVRGRGSASAGRGVSGSTTATAAASGAGLVVRAVDVTGLAPGVTRSVAVTVANEGVEPVLLERVVGRSTGAAGLPAGCPATSISVRDWVASSGDGELAPGTSRTVEVLVTMPETGRNQDACKAARFALAYTATGRIA